MRLLLAAALAAACSDVPAVEPDADLCTGSGAPDPSFGNRGLVVDDGDAVGVGATETGAVLVATWTFAVDFGVVRFLADGALDPEYGAGGVASADLSDATGYAKPTASAFAPDGSAFVIGDRVEGGTSDRPLAVARFLPDGTLDPGFAGGTAVFRRAGVSGWRRAALPGDGALVAVATATDGLTRPLVARVGRDGILDASFGAGGFGDAMPPGWTRGWGQDIAVQPDGAILVAASVELPTGEGFGVARLAPDGTLDASFGEGGGAAQMMPDASANVAAIALAPDGGIVVAGHLGSPAGARCVAARFLADGTVDTAFGGGLVTTAVEGWDCSATTAVVQPDGFVVLGGRARGGLQDFLALVRIAPDGSLDPCFAGDGHDLIELAGVEGGLQALALQPNGRLVGAGYMIDAFGAYRMIVVRVLP